jgi:nuclear GTP-binding protein
MHETYVERLEQAKLLSGTSGEEASETFADNPNGELTSAREFIFMKGTSKRIWNELYKARSNDILSINCANYPSRSLTRPMSSCTS